MPTASSPFFNRTKKPPPQCFSLMYVFSQCENYRILPASRILGKIKLVGLGSRGRIPLKSEDICNPKECLVVWEVTQKCLIMVSLKVRSVKDMKWETTLIGGLQGLETGVNEVAEAETIVHNYNNQVLSWPSPIFLPPSSAVQLAPCCIFVWQCMQREQAGVS